MASSAPTSDAITSGDIGESCNDNFKRYSVDNRESGEEEEVIRVNMESLLLLFAAIFK